MSDREEITTVAKKLTVEEQRALDQQNARLVTPYKASQLEQNARKHWDLFYKRNEDKFFKDRHWTTREFKELVDDPCEQTRILLEVGCGVGNFIFPLVEENLNMYIIGCDFSPRAIKIVQDNNLYDTKYMKAFQCDITTEQIFSELDENTVDVVTLIFVLSAIHPNKFVITLKNIYKLLKSGGVVLFRDYGLYDMAQLRFKPGHKIAENLYMRQDGTRSYYFSVEFLEELFTQSGFEVVNNSYINRRTINKKENIDVPRLFVQAKAIKAA